MHCGVHYYLQNLKLRFNCCMEKKKEKLYYGVKWIEWHSLEGKLQFMELFRLWLYLKGVNLTFFLVLPTWHYMWTMTWQGYFLKSTSLIPKSVITMKLWTSSVFCWPISILSICGNLYPYTGYIWIFMPFFKKKLWI